MINFTIDEFYELWEDVAPEVESSLNIGRGKYCSNSLQDLFFMLMVVLHAGGTWDFYAPMFKLQVSTFEKNMVSLLCTVIPIIYRLYIIDPEKTWKYFCLVEEDVGFSNFSCAHYAMKFFFYPCYLPSCWRYEVKLWYSGKQNLYGYKTEISVAPCELAVHVSVHCHWSFAYI